MAETHKEIVKVWIAPGCIVCDACEADCPEVFDVQEETCIIRPPAMSAAFTQNLTPSIIVAAEGCPVDVIKFDTIDVAGPEPAAWAEKEAVAAPAAGGGGAAAGGGKKAAIVYDGPPDPKWARLLSTSHTSSHTGVVQPKTIQPAKAPASAIAAALSTNAPPDAVAAAMVGSGFARPRPSVADTIRDRAAALAAIANMSRRSFAISLVVAWGAMAAVGAICLGAFQDFFVPKVTKEPPSTFRAGRVSDFAVPGTVYEQFKATNGVWIVHLADNKIVALSDICTHLGCIPNWLPGDQKFKCPCHGSGYYITGVNFEGPTPRPLERFKITMDGEFIVVDKSSIYRQELGQWDTPGSFLAV